MYKRQKILIENARQIVLDKKYNRLYILTQENSEQPVVTHINIAQQDFTPFIDCIKKLNGNIIYTESEEN